MVDVRFICGNFVFPVSGQSPLYALEGFSILYLRFYFLVPDRFFLDFWFWDNDSPVGPVCGELAWSLVA